MPAEIRNSGVRVSVEWIDAGREPQCPPDPRFPDGKHLGIGYPGNACMVSLPYPAKRCGAYIVTCQRCGANAAITTAGRADDPKSLTLPCRTMARE